MLDRVADPTGTRLRLRRVDFGHYTVRGARVWWMWACPCRTGGMATTHTTALKAAVNHLLDCPRDWPL